MWISLFVIVGAGWICAVWLVVVWLVDVHVHVACACACAYVHVHVACHMCMCMCIESRLSFADSYEKEMSARPSVMLT